MADHGHGAHGAAHDAAHGAAVAAPHHHEEHPTWSTYWKVALVLTIITAVEVSAYYIKTWEESWVYVPSMLIMSAVKFFIVVMYYMHLKYDHRLFRSLFTGPLVIAMLTLVGLLFLFAKLTVRLGLLQNG